MIDGTKVSDSATAEIVPKHNSGYLCQRCGKCCETYSFIMHNRFADEDTTEIAKLIKFHGCSPVRCKDPEGGKDFLGIQIPMTCVHLIREGDKMACRIYENRPIVCKNYFCKKVKDKTVADLAKNGIHV